METATPHIELLNALAKRVWTRLLAEYPDWQPHFEAKDGDLEVAVPAPLGSKAGHLIISTARGEDIWVRYSLPYMSYGVDDEDEMLSIVKELLAEQAAFVVIMSGSEWTETTLLRPGQEPRVESGQVAHVVSWSGVHDKTISARPGLSQ
jgi:hypothetical protein